MHPFDTDPLDYRDNNDESELLYEELDDYLHCHARSEEEGWYYPDEDEPEVSCNPWRAVDF